MYHVCFSNPGAWEISYKKGVYGNVETGNATPMVFWGKMVDLIALKPGDKIYFYVKESMVMHGLFEVASEPFYCEDNLFQNSNEKYPFRFNFIELKHFDYPIPVSELAKLIECGLLSSITTFERDVNASFRGIRQLTNDEGEQIEEIFFRFNPKANYQALKKYDQDEIVDELEARDIIKSVTEEDEQYIKPTAIRFTKIPVKRVRKEVYVSQYENALQGYIYYCLRRELLDVIEDIDLKNFTECLMEVPMLKAQQFRSDILCLYRHSDKKPHFYSIIEIKRDKDISIDNLSQLIGYMKTFTSSKGIPFNCIEGIYISTAFESDAVEYLRNRKSVEKENPVRLIEYEVSKDGKVKFNRIDI